MKVRFGTDGWRGVMAREFTFDNVRRVAAALAVELEKRCEADRGVAVGYDRRFLSPRFAEEAAATLAACGVTVHLAEEPLPTPVLSWAVRDLALGAGLMVTASHNPPEWNGLKIKEPYGGPAALETVRAVEEEVGRAQVANEAVRRMNPAEARRKDRILPLRCREGYGVALAKWIDFDAIAAAAPGVAYDAMHGVGAGWLDERLEAGGARVTRLRCGADPLFGGVAPEPTPDRLAGLFAAVAQGGFALGLANDGDADRIAATDARGDYFSPQNVLAVFLRYLREAKGLTGEVVKTVSATSAMDLLAEKYGLPVHTVPIGFKHVGARMREAEVLLGGEESGAIGVTAHLPERDGVFNGLLLTEIAAVAGNGLGGYLQEIFDEVGAFTYGRRDYRAKPEEIGPARSRLADVDPPAALCGLPVATVDTTDGTKFIREDLSWLLLRVSGTEPLVRVYAEARSPGEVETLLNEGRRLAGL